MLLKNYFTNEYNEIEGTAFFPYFKKEIHVICWEGTSLEYAQKCLEYLQKVDEALILQICKYAQFYLEDLLETTSIGELYYGDEEPFPHEQLLDMLQYICFEVLYIEEPAVPVKDSDRVLNLYGGCDWQEDDGIQCLVKNGEVIFLGGYNRFSVWEDFSKEKYFNYVYYEKRGEMSAVPDIEEGDYWAIERTVRWKNKGLLDPRRLEEFTDTVIAAKENVSPKEAAQILEETYLFQMMQEYPKLLDESSDFWLECYCIEKEKDNGELVKYICENCQWDLF